MALGEKRRTVRKNQTISQVSWTDGISLDPYYGLEHSFQYSNNINCDDELHGLKLSQKALRYNDTTQKKLGKCQLVSIGDNGVIALPVGSVASKVRVFDTGRSGENFENGGAEFGGGRGGSNNCPGVVFQDRFWRGIRTTDSTPLAGMGATDRARTTEVYVPYDHQEATDESISDPSQAKLGVHMTGPITAILNYNNTRLVVADGADIWVYYPELDRSNPYNTEIYDSTVDPGKTGWKKTLTFEAGVVIVGLTCTFEYLKVRCRDEGWNTKIYYYQGNNNLRDTFVYNVIDLTGQRVIRAYSINSVDYYVASMDGTEGLVNLNKMVGNTPYQLLKQRAGLTSLDVNRKAPQFVGPISLDAPYQGGRFYIADAYGVFSFDFNPTGYDPGYMKWGLNNNKKVYGACINKNYLYVSDDDGCWKIRLYDTGVDGYQDHGILISREFEGLEGGTMTKMLDSIKLNYELNPLTDENGTIDVFVSPNNLWKNTNLYYNSKYGTYLPKGTGLPANMGDYSSSEFDGWYHVMHLDQTNIGTRTERMEVLNKLGPDGVPAFGFDRQTITYAIVINKGDENRATPIVRQIDINYHTKDKVNNVYDINQNT